MINMTHINFTITITEGITIMITGLNYGHYLSTIPLVSGRDVVQTTLTFSI